MAGTVEKRGSQMILIDPAAAAPATDLGDGHTCDLPSGPPSDRNESRSLLPLFAALYSELRHRAAGHMRGMASHTLQPTALVNEAYVRLQNAGGHWDSHDHLLLAASSAMRHVLVDYFRSRTNGKRPPVSHDTDVEELACSFQERANDLSALDEALESLEEHDATMARVVELHFFGGVSMAETARMVGLPTRSLERRWSATKAWLHHQVLAQ